MYWMVLIARSFCCLFFLFKQKTAYEMRISDWSSDVCSSDLTLAWATMRVIGSFGLIVSPVTLAKARRLRCAKSQPRTIEFGAVGTAGAFAKIGRASCRERVCQYV